MLGPMPVEDQSCILKSEKLSRRKKWKILNAFLSPRRVFLNYYFIVWRPGSFLTPNPSQLVLTAMNISF